MGKKPAIIYIALALSIAFLVCSSYILNRALNNSAERVAGPLEKLSHSLASNEDLKLPEITIYFQESKKQWKKNEKWWQMLIDHRESHSIATSFIRLEQLLEQKDKKESQLEVAQLLFLVQHLPDQMKASPENII
ncbi:MAG: DUF4363 family protein [Clostridiales bacterium]|nr:DUF4363 family protein [Clostridiales bacterium]